ncbi:oligopeptide/dipeptide ABC transporter ATP-binding protein [Acetobacter sp. DsW_063]|uniref:oligopeptide/dipeptide ABC transporter ATP-binding protein n=1 Tax=Acetobacter sp. DsW_063 TaxID=1514894 RepID=UPI000A39B315|nr:oligopeptide/dipeptide ABC transporter ATP-binding protein [Acetobacter sp. DsW_063]OUJ16167.1 hypothetical protein HK28_02785 [Acetobacter sp. DsW_063]
MTAPVLSVQGVSKTYTQRAGLFGRPSQTYALREVSFDLRTGEILGLVGESGSGKTTAGRIAMRLVEPSDGKIHLAGQDVTGLSGAALRPMRRRIQLIFQDPSASLNPRQTIRQILRTPLRLRGITDDAEIVRMLAIIGMGAEALDRTPAMFSGGQRQRLSIARALLMNPDIIVADEAVSALDVCVQAQVVNLLLDLRDQFGLSILFIGHDLGVVGLISDRVGVMFRGSLVEIAPSRELFERPRHPYTARLLAAAPRQGGKLTPHAEVDTGRFSPTSVEGCAFAALCPHAITECRTTRPVMREIAPDHWTACRRADLDLRPAHC